MPERGIKRFSLKKLLSHNTEKLRRWTLLCVTIFGYRKTLRFVELCHDFVSMFFCLTVPRNFVENPSVMCFRKFPVAKKFEDRRGGEGSIMIFRRNFFVSQCRKNSSRNLSVLCFRKFLAAKKFMDNKGVSNKIFRRRFFVSQCRKTS